MQDLNGIGFKRVPVQCEMEKFSEIEACPVNFWHFYIYSKQSLEVVVKLN